MNDDDLISRRTVRALIPAYVHGDHYVAFDRAIAALPAVSAPDVAELVEAAGELADAFAKQIGDRKHSAWPVIRRVRAALARIGG